MYRILGADNQEYGPVPPEVVRRWISERRLDARSMVRREGDPAWKPLAEFPEFQGGGPPAPKPGSPPASAAPTLAGGKRTSGLAIAAFILGLLSPCTLGVSAFPGIVLGIVALKKIRRSGGQAGGRGLAMTGLIFSILFLLIAPPLFLLGIRQHQVHRNGSPVNPTEECASHLQQLAKAVRSYSNDNNDRFPTATWCDAIQSGLSDLTAFQCPSRPGLRSGYAMNAAVLGKVRYEVAPDTVLLFESEQGWNALGNASAMIPASRHGSISVAFADGTVRSINPDNLSTLRWMP
jgi:hypothetical protein